MQASTSSSSFSASREGRSRPANIFASSRSNSDDRPWPSPSFNSSMSLGKVEDVFVDSNRSKEKLRSIYLGLPPTPVSAGVTGSPNHNRAERLPSLSDIFHQDILAPLTPSGTPKQPNSLSLSPNQTNESSCQPTSATWTTDRFWPSHSDNHERMGPPATPLTPFFKQETNLPSPPLRSSSSYVVHHSSPERPTIGLGVDLETTPKPSSSHQVSPVAKSPRFPSAPLIGCCEDGVFEPLLSSSPEKKQRDLYRPPSLGFGWSHFQQPHNVESYPFSSPMEREEMVQLETNLPKVDGLIGLGIGSHDDSSQSKERGSPPRQAHNVQQQQQKQLQQVTKNGNSGTSFKSPTSSGKTNDKVSTIQHTGLTPLVRSTRISMPSTSSSASSETPTKRSASTIGGSGNKRSIQDSSPLLDPTSPKSPTKKIVKEKTENIKSTSSSSSSSSISYNNQTPIKSKPMFRLDNGSAKKKSSKPKGHNMPASGSPWGVFGIKDEWRPLAPPTISKSGTTNISNRKPCQEISNNLTDSQQQQQQESLPLLSPVKREAVASSSSHQNHYPSPKRPKSSVVNLKDISQSPFKENRTSSSSPLKRSHLTSTTTSSPFRSFSSPKKSVIAFIR